MASKVTRTAVIAVSALGVSGLVATSAEAAPPTIPSTLVNQPAVTAVTNLTPESATLNGVVDTGGNPMSSFTVAPNTTFDWDNSVELSGGTSAGNKYNVDGIPVNASYNTYPTSSTSVGLQNGGADNFSSVLFEYDPASDYLANGDNPGPETSFASELEEPTDLGLSSVSTNIGGYPAATATGIAGALTPNTKYVYFIVQQAGATDDAVDVNTFNPSSSTASTSTNPSYTCYPDSYVAAVAPYNTYTTSGTLSGGVSSPGVPQTAPQPQIQGPCVYYYGGSANYYNSAPGTFTTPSLGSVFIGNAVIAATKKTVTKTSGTKATGIKKVTTTSLSNIKAAVVVRDNSVEGAKGTFKLTDGGSTVGSGSFNVSAKASQAVKLSLTGKGKSLIAKGKAFYARLSYTTTTDQPTTTKSVKL